MKIIQISLLILVLFVAQGCNKEGVLTEQTHQATLLLKVASGVGSAVDPENQLNDVRVFSFHTSASTRGLLDVNSGKQQLPADRPLTQAMRVGVRDIYVMANEGAVSGLTDAFDGIRNLTDLTAIRLPYEPLTLAPPFVSTYKEQVEITKDGATQVDAKVVRTLSKVVLTLSYEWGYGKPMPPDFIIHSVQVKNLPEYSYLISQRYDGTAFTSSREVTADELVNQSPTPNSSYQSKPLTIYIPEFIGASSAKGNHAYLEIVGYSTSRPVPVTSTYRMSLSSNMAADGTIADDNYDIARNTSFTINGTINGEGELGLVFIEAHILDWNEVNSTPEEVGDYLIVDETTKPLKFTIKEDITIKASDLSKVAISSKNNKLDWTLSGNTISVGVKDAFATDVPQAAIDELIITLGQFTRRVNIDYRPSVAQRFAKGLLVMNGTGGATIGAPNAPFKDVLIFKWSTIIGMRTCDDAGTPLPTAQVAYNPTIHNVSSPQLITPYIPNTVTEAQYIGRDKDFLNYLHERTDLHNGGLGDPCREIGTVAGKRWRTPTASEWDELLSETPKAANLSPGKAIGFGGYVPRQSGTSSDAGFVNNAHYGWFYGPSAQQQTDAANPTKGSVFIYQKYYGTSDITQNVGITSPPTQNIFSSSASSTAGRFHYYTANDVVGSMGTRPIGDDKTVGNSFAVRCIQQ